MNVMVIHFAVGAFGTMHRDLEKKLDRVVMRSITEIIRHNKNSLDTEESAGELRRQSIKIGVKNRWKYKDNKM